eukprot:7377270-Prymnesium_polylepis.3
MREGGVPPDVAAFNAALDACARAGAGGEAAGLLKEMAAEGAPPNSYSYRAAIQAYGRARQWESALELVRARAARRAPRRTHSKQHEARPALEPPLPRGAP